MAHLVARKGGAFDIRESAATTNGPRSRTLATFRGSLTPEVLERAAARAERPFDPNGLTARALELGVLVTRRREDRTPRELLSHLRHGGAIDPVLATLLRDELARTSEATVPEALSEVAEWVGVDDVRRSEALRGLLRVSDRVLQGRRPLRERLAPVFPRFSSRQRERR